MTNSSIVASGKKFDIGCRVVLWNEEEGLSFYPKGGYTPRKLSYKQLQNVVKCFVLHHSVTYTAHATFRGLLGRKLSVNFIIDDDVNDEGYATIYQCLDIKDYGWSHKPLNSAGPGVEISYHPQAWENKNLYSETNVKKWGVQPHNIEKDKVHGRGFNVFAPTEAQIKSSIALMAGMCRAFPNMKGTFPKDQDNQIYKTVANEQSNMLAHFHITRNKVDPMGFPFERAEKEITEINTFWCPQNKNLWQEIREWLK